MFHAMQKKRRVTKLLSEVRLLYTKIFKNTMRSIQFSGLQDSRDVLESVDNLSGFYYLVLVQEREVP